MWHTHTHLSLAACFPLDGKTMLTGCCHYYIPSTTMLEEEAESSSYKNYIERERVAAWHLGLEQAKAKNRGNAENLPFFVAFDIKCRGSLAF